MYGLPPSTSRRKQLPKSLLFERLQLKTDRRKAFDEDVSRLFIEEFVSPRTVKGFAEGAGVKEFYVLRLVLKRKDFRVQNVGVLSRMIPQHFICALHFEGEVCFATAVEGMMVCGKWMKEEEVAMGVNHLTVNEMWEVVIKKLAGIGAEVEGNLDELLQEKRRVERIEYEIERLERKCRAEKRSQRKYALFRQLQELKATL